MARGAPDFGAVAPRELTATVQDLGELAVRLGSPVIFDRRGTVVAIIGATTMAWHGGTVNGASARIDLIPSFTLGGGYSMRMDVTGPGQWVATTQVTPFYPDESFGSEVVWRSSGILDAQVELSAVGRDGATFWSAAIRWNDVTGTWQYLSAAGVWTDTPIQAAGYRRDRWASMKIAVDMPSSLYLYGVADAQDLGLRGIAARQGSTVEGGLVGSVTLRAGAGARSVIDLANLILTVNEI
ncbi:hypothetical protein LCGC14_1139400 [marine sediment metagenome]|uniref:Uncharacterized protein n=1 Tax=marine sediment metagenome TaxID=412755 RepID=A0A0F9M3L1_9ZZZZ